MIMTGPSIAVVTISCCVSHTLLMRRNFPMLVGMTQLRRYK